MAVESDKDLLKLKNRFRELADKSYKQNIFLFTGFLGLSEQNELWKMEKELSYAGITLFGGYEHADRVMVRFGSMKELGYEEEFPIVCVHIKPLLAKFADDFSHRDFLGALMNLGIERSTMGDIRLVEREGYLFCQDTIAEYICQYLDKVKHTNVKCQIIEKTADFVEEEPDESTAMVSSLRIDGIIAKTYNLSRNESLVLFQSRLVFVNGRLCENNSYQLKPGDVINARGHGKFIFQGIKYESKKGKQCISLLIYR